MQESPQKNETSLSDRLAIDRTLLANVRTLLSFIRTALALIAGGIGLTEFFHSWITGLIGWILVSVGVLTGIWGFKRYQITASHIRDIQR